ncbi:hypothetical protein SETIT_4G064000v2 [Setaria italica]|uniref:Transcription elongation factor 1 homolog n=1 Tax=Setaria italica TaxID=4555 RepID=K3Y139_SETIT|nr:hypothetical protein SETIT_4G064000v2 [Setaria italica]
MGKRKLKTSKSMAAPRKLLKLDTLFTCPFRGYPDAVGCHIDLKDRIAKASESYFTSAHVLTAAVDVYCEWIDACKLANEGVIDRRCRPRLVEA